MAGLKQSSPLPNSEVEITLGLLNAVHENDSVTQRSMARELGIALGLANAYLKRCVKKGFVKVQQIPKNRYAYYLTPQGFAEKSRLTAEYLSISFNFFRTARNQSDKLLRLCAEQGWRNVVMVGCSDLEEIATLCAREYSINLIGVVDLTGEASSCSGLPVFRDFDSLGEIEAAIITDLLNPQSAYDYAVTILPRDRVLAPELLKISQRPLRLEE